MKRPLPSKFELYEASVQSPELHVEFFGQISADLRGKRTGVLREDFCGTFALSCKWIQESAANAAVSLDLDPEPLDYGLKHHASQLSRTERKRLSVLREDVLKTKARADLIAANNFSFYFFKQRRQLLSYFSRCLKTLNPGGVLILEMAGGPGMIEQMKEIKKVKLAGLGSFTYVWDQQSFDPITHDAKYAIHFKLPDGSKIENAFTYDWRLWTIPEVRDALADAGFKSTMVWWEKSHRDEHVGSYAPREHGENDYAWVAYVVGTQG